MDTLKKIIQSAKVIGTWLTPLNVKDLVVGLKNVWRKK